MVEHCAACHEGVASVEDLKNQRMRSSMMDYDGDGDVDEGMYYEIQGLQEILYAEIQLHHRYQGWGLSMTPSHPYFFVDDDGDGAADQAEGRAVGYTNWTPRLLKAAYNYQVSVKDPGAFAHGNKYIVELLYDSIEDLGGDVSKLTRNDAGHFAGNTEPFRHWDGEEDGGIVPGSCAKCHSAAGLPQLIAEGAVISNPASNGFQCSTCHDEANWPNRYEIASVTFPSGKAVSFAVDGMATGRDDSICASPSGSTSTASVNRTSRRRRRRRQVAALSFRTYYCRRRNALWNDVQGAYQYEDQAYLGRNTVHPLNKCKDCHDVHKLEPKFEACATCHGDTAPENIRFNTDTTDWDGDGDVTEGIKGEISTLAEALYAEIQTYAESHGGPISYDAHVYPYFMGADGKAYAGWTPRLLRAAYNYQYVQKDPGAFVHNPKYVIQFLYDSIRDLGGDVSQYTRP
jgi:hypothetical protein